MKIVWLAMLATVMATDVAGADAEVARMAKFKMVIDSDGSGEDATRVWSSDDMNFDLDTLAPGEMQTFTDDSGEIVTVSRGEHGFTFEVAGESFEIPDFGDDSAHMAVLSIDDLTQDISAESGTGSLTMSAHSGAADIVIISPEPLDSSVRESIKSVLVSAGNNNDVKFVDGSRREERVMVLKKEIEITQ